MKTVKRIFSACVLTAVITPYVAVAADGNWKTGRLYYRMVCTACHINIRYGYWVRGSWEIPPEADLGVAGLGVSVLASCFFTGADCLEADSRA